MKAFIRSLVQINTVVSEKIWFEFLYVHNLGPRSRNDLDLQYSYIFIKSICLRSLAAIVLVQRANGHVNTHLISWPSKTQNIQNLENIYDKEMTLTFNTHITS